VNLKRSYADKFNEVLPVAKAARSLQIETKVRSLLRLELARNIPLVSRGIRAITILLSETLRFLISSLGSSDEEDS